MAQTSAMSSSAGFARQQARQIGGAASDARVAFSEVANYVNQSSSPAKKRGSRPITTSLDSGATFEPSSELPDASLSMINSPTAEAGTTSVPLARGGLVATSSSLQAQVPPDGAPGSPKDGDLPPLRVGRAERLGSQLEWLRMEKSVETEQMKKVERSLHDSLMHEQKARLRAEQSREQYELQMKRMMVLEKQMQSVSEELGAHSLPSRGSVRNRTPATANSSSDKGGLFMRTASTATGGGSRQTSSQMSRQSERLPHKAAPRAESMPAFTNAPGRPDSSIEESAMQESATAPIGGVSLEDYFAKQSSGLGAGSTKRASASAPALATVEDERPVEEVQEQFRTHIREEMVKSAGGAKQAFRKIDLNGSGHISQQEFADGVTRLGVNWQAITGMKRPREVFKLFDQNKDGVLDYQELFPVEAQREAAYRPRATTPNFWKDWCRNNPETAFEKRPPNWCPANPEEELEVLFKYQSATKEAESHRRWMAASFKRLKNKGKSDARCREIVALHLPRGNGPRDREGVATLSDADLRKCKKLYTDEVLEPVKNIQKVVYDMRDTRRVLQGFKQQLFHVSMEPMLQAKREEERKQAASSFTGLSMLKKVKDGADDDRDKEQPAPAQSGPNSFAVIARNAKMDEDKLHDLYKAFTARTDEKSELMSKKKFTKMLEFVAPNRTLVDKDVEAWWNQSRNLAHSGDAPGDGGNVEPKTRKNQINFEQFIMWYADSEMRTAK